MEPNAHIFTVVIDEQPVSHYRFRYEVECRTNGSILGVNSTQERTNPAIIINNYLGPVTIEVSCVTKDPPHMPHPFKLVGRHCNPAGVFKIQTSITMLSQIVQLENIGIQCIKRSQLWKAMELRATAQVDPFGTGFAYDFENHDGHHVRLAIQVTTANDEKQVICTNVITNLTNQLSIVNYAPSWGSARGGTLMRPMDVSVWFTEPTTGWVVYVRPSEVHMLCALVVTTPPYRNPDTEDHVLVEVYLQRTPGENEPAVSNRVQFEYIPEPRALSPEMQPPAKRPMNRNKRLHESLQFQVKDRSPLHDFRLHATPPGQLAEPEDESSLQFDFNHPNDLLDLDTVLLKELNRPLESTSASDNQSYFGLGRINPNDEPPTAGPSTSMGQTTDLNRQSFYDEQLFAPGLEVRQQPIPSKNTSMGQHISTGHPYSTGYPNSSMGQHFTGQDFLTGYSNSSMGQPSTAGPLFSTGYLNSTMGQTNPQSLSEPISSPKRLSLMEIKFNDRKVSNSGQHVPTQKVQPSPRNGQTIRHPQSLNSLNRSMSTSGHTSSMGPASLSRATSTTGHPSSSMGPASVNRATSTTGHPSSSMGPASVNRATSTTGHPSSSMGPASVNRATSTTGHPSSSIGPAFLNRATSRQPSSNRQIPTAEQLLQPSFTSTATPSPYSVQNFVSSPYGHWRQTDSPGQDSPSPFLEVTDQYSSTGLETQMRQAVPENQHLPGLQLYEQQMVTEVADIGTQQDEDEDATMLSLFPDLALGGLRDSLD